MLRGQVALTAGFPEAHHEHSSGGTGTLMLAQLFEMQIPSHKQQWQTRAQEGQRPICELTIGWVWLYRYVSLSSDRLANSSGATSSISLYVMPSNVPA